MAEELWKNKEYVKLIEKVRNKIITAYETGIVGEARKGKIIPIDTTMLNRSLNAILAQPDYAFLDKMKKFVDGNPVQLAHQIIQHEDGLLRGFQAVLGQEAHHILPQNVMKWVKDIPVEKALEALHVYRQRGGTTGVVKENLRIGGQMVHRAMDQASLLKDVATERVKDLGTLFSAHVDPWSDRLKNAPDFFAKGFIRLMPKGIKDLPDQFFKIDDSIEYIVETLEDQAGGPGKLFSRAFDSKIEVETRNYYKNLLGGEDIFKMAEEGSNPTLLKKYKLLLKDIFEPLKMNYNDIFKKVARGEDLPQFSEEILDVISKFKENPKLSSNKLTNMVKRAYESPVVRTVRDVVGRTPRGVATRVLAAAPVAGVTIDVGKAVASTHTAYQDPSVKNIVRAGGNIIEAIDQTPFFVGPYVNHMLHQATDEALKTAEGKKKIKEETERMEEELLPFGTTM